MLPCVRGVLLPLYLIRKYIIVKIIYGLFYTAG